MLKLIVKEQITIARTLRGYIRSEDRNLFNSIEDLKTRFPETVKRMTPAEVDILYETLMKRIG